VRVVRRKITTRRVDVLYKPGKIAAVCNALGVSRPVFAGTLNVSPGTPGVEQSATEWAGRLETLYPDGRTP
jgi:3-hydroxymyristoyl/3-hydroxydecanoyl-(acyl carrier protein) dehydratase